MVFYGDDLPFELEACYYLNFQIKSALYSITQMEREAVPENHIGENVSEHYHFYTDHLMFSLGQIANRFLINLKSDSAEIKKRKEKNKINFAFDEVQYPILSNKMFRNTVEHIDEHNHAIIQQFDGVGGFNVIFPDSSVELVDALCARRNVHPYTLDLVNKELWIVRHGEELNLRLNELKSELQKLQKRVDKVHDYATRPF